MKLCGTYPPVSEGKLDTTLVNGPADDALCWDAVDWRFHEDNVRRLRQRIFTAARDGDLGKLRNLQKLMLRSWSNTLLSVRQATQRNAGRKTAGVDGEVALSALARPSWRCRCTVMLGRGDRCRSNGSTYPRRVTVRSCGRSGFR